MPSQFHLNFHRRCFLLTALLLSHCAGTAYAQTLYETTHEVMLETIRNGEVSGRMGGDMARQFERQFKSRGTLLFKAKRLFLFKQPGCARVAIDYTKKDIVTPTGMTDVKLNTQINYCLDGRAPQSLEQTG